MSLTNPEGIERKSSRQSPLKRVAELLVEKRFLMISRGLVR